MGVGLNDNNAILNSVDVVVEVGVELGNNIFLFRTYTVLDKKHFGTYHIVNLFLL